MRASLRVTLVAALVLTGASVEAQTDASEAARSLLVEQARAAGARGDHAEAASLAERALEIHSTASLRLFLAEQRIALGRDVEALAEVERCRREANPARPQEAPVRRNCEVLRRALVGRLAVVQLRVDPPGAIAHVGDQLVPSDGAPTAVVAGEFPLRVTLDGYVTHEARITLARGELRDLSLRLDPQPPPPSARVAEPPPSDPPAVVTSVVAAQPPTARTPVVTAPQASPSRWTPTWPTVASLSAGVVLLAVVTPLLAAQRDSLASACTRTVDDDLRCPDVSSYDDARTANEVVQPAVVTAGVVGGLSLLFGAAWWLHGALSQPAARPVVTAGAGPRSLTLSIAF